MARKDVQDEPDYFGGGDMSIMVQFSSSSDPTWIC